MATPQGQRRVPRYPMYAVLPSEVGCCVDHPLSDRMPLIIGNFISRHVYSSKLRTEHLIKTLTCCRFVDVNKGNEIRRGMSWTVCLPSKIPLPSDLAAKIYPLLRTKERSTLQFKSPVDTSGKENPSKSSLPTTPSETRSKKH